MTSLESTNRHSCHHCGITLKAPHNLPQSVFRIALPLSIKEAQKASRDGCPIFQELLLHHSSRSLSQLLKSHLFSKCDCCSGWLQRLRYLWKSFGPSPFQLLFMASPSTATPGSSLNSFAYLDCGNGPVGVRFNAYTHSGNYILFFVRRAGFLNCKMS